MLKNRENILDFSNGEEYNSDDKKMLLGGVFMWEILRCWLVGDMGTPGEYQYQAIHLYTVLAVVLVCVLATLPCYSRRISDKQKKRILIFIKRY